MQNITKSTVAQAVGSLDSRLIPLSKASHEVALCRPLGLEKGEGALKYKGSNNPVRRIEMLCIDANGKLSMAESHLTNKRVKVSKLKRYDLFPTKCWSYIYYMSLESDGNEIIPGDHKNECPDQYWTKSATQDCIMYRILKNYPLIWKEDLERRGQVYNSSVLVLERDNKTQKAHMVLYSTRESITFSLGSKVCQDLRYPKDKGSRINPTQLIGCTPLAAGPKWKRKTDTYRLIDIDQASNKGLKTLIDRVSLTSKKFNVLELYYEGDLYMTTPIRTGFCWKLVPEILRGGKLNTLSDNMIQDFDEPYASVEDFCARLHEGLEQTYNNLKWRVMLLPLGDNAYHAVWTTKKYKGEVADRQAAVGGFKVTRVDLDSLTANDWRRRAIAKMPYFDTDMNKYAYRKSDERLSAKELIDTTELKIIPLDKLLGFPHADKNTGARVKGFYESYQVSTAMNQNHCMHVSASVAGVVTKNPLFYNLAMYRAVSHLLIQTNIMDTAGERVSVADGVALDIEQIFHSIMRNQPTRGFKQEDAVELMNDMWLNKGSINFSNGVTHATARVPVIEHPYTWKEMECLCETLETYGFANTVTGEEFETCVAMLVFNHLPGRLTEKLAILLALYNYSVRVTDIGLWDSMYTMIEDDFGVKQKVLETAELNYDMDYTIGASVNRFIVYANKDKGPNELEIILTKPMDYKKPEKVVNENEQVSALPQNPNLIAMVQRISEGLKDDDSEPEAAGEYWVPKKAGLYWLEKGGAVIRYPDGTICRVKKNMENERVVESEIPYKALYYSSRPGFVLKVTGVTDLGSGVYIVQSEESEEKEKKLTIGDTEHINSIWGLFSAVLREDVQLLFNYDADVVDRVTFYLSSSENFEKLLAGQKTSRDVLLYVNCSLRRKIVACEEWDNFVTHMIVETERSITASKVKIGAMGWLQSGEWLLLDQLRKRGIVDDILEVFRPRIKGYFNTFLLILTWLIPFMPLLILAFFEAYTRHHMYSVTSVLFDWNQDNLVSSMFSSVPLIGILTLLIRYRPWFVKLLVLIWFGLWLLTFLIGYKAWKRMHPQVIHVYQETKDTITGVYRKASEQSLRAVNLLRKMIRRTKVQEAAFEKAIENAMQSGKSYQEALLLAILEYKNIVGLELVVAVKLLEMPGMTHQKVYIAVDTMLKMDPWLRGKVQTLLKIASTGDSRIAGRVQKLTEKHRRDLQAKFAKPEGTNLKPYPPVEEIMNKVDVQEPIPDPLEVPLLPLEYNWYGPHCPEHSMLGGLWALIVRHITPLIRPDPDLDPKFDTATLIDEVRRDHHPATSFDEYLKSVLPSKRKAYQKGYKQFKKTGSIPMNLSAVVKPFESQYKATRAGFDGLKPRNIFNPSEQVKAVCGWFASNLMKKIKRTKTFGPHFIQGMNTTELSKRILEGYRQVDNPVCYAWDGGRHDAHQHADFIKACDNEIINGLGYQLCADMGLGRPEADEIVKKTTLTNCQITLYFTKAISGLKLFGSKRIVCYSGKLNGTVFSGHPTRTTLGNTIRVLLLIKRISDDAGLTWQKDIYPFQAGDDTLVIINKEKLQAFKDAQMVYYATDEEQGQHGYGQLATDLVSHEHRFEFLSKIGYVDNERCILMRQPKRITTTGMIDKTSIGLENLNSSVIDALKKEYGNSFGIKNYLRWREELLPKGKVLKIIEWDPESVYKLVEGGYDVDQLDCVLLGVERQLTVLETNGGNPLPLWMMEGDMPDHL